MELPTASTHKAEEGDEEEAAPDEWGAKDASESTDHESSRLHLAGSARHVRERGEVPLIMCAGN